MNLQPDKKAKKAKADSDSSDEDNEDQLKKFLKGEDLSDDNDDSFKINMSAENDARYSSEYYFGQLIDPQICLKEYHIMFHQL